MGIISDFMLKITDKLMSEKKVGENTAINYMKHLYNLNNQRPFNNLSFLKQKDRVEKVQLEKDYLEKLTKIY